jgi:hypothetical protein
MNMALPESVKVWSQFGHPMMMWALLALSIYALKLGIQAKKVRTTEDKEVRKELIKQKPNIKHHQIGSLLLALMVLGTVGGMAVTYINNGKLFVGPHLLVGLGMTTLIATSASLVPWMKEGNELARKAHVGLNMTLLLLFGWQAWTGVEIVQKIVSKL